MASYKFFRQLEGIGMEHLIIVEETDPVDFRLQQRKSAVPLSGRGWRRRPAQIVDTKRRKLPADGSDTLSGRIDHDNLIRPARLILQRLEHSPQIFGAVSGWCDKGNAQCTGCLLNYDFIHINFTAAVSKLFLPLYSNV